MKTSSKILINKLEKIHSIILNTQQKKVVEEISSILLKPRIIFQFASLFKKKKKGIYLYGPAGRGKTIIINHFIKTLDKKNSIKFHFNDLIFQLQKFNFSSNKEFSKELRKKKLFIPNLKNIFIDELDINNIADIIILQKFLDQAKMLNIFVMFTSNKSPENLYKNNHHKKTLSKLNEYFLQEFHLIRLKHNRDYRKNSSNFSNFIFNKSDNDMITLRKKIVGDITPKDTKFIRSGNSFILRHIYKDLLECDFDYICGKNLSFKDYKLILKKINFVFLRNVPILNKSINDKVKRFVYLVDAIYEGGKILSISTQFKLNDLYKQKDNMIDCERTISRLNQILSEKYIIDNFHNKPNL